MARTVSRTETADGDTCAEIKALCRQTGVSLAEYYHTAGLASELSLPMFYAALRGDAVTAGTERAIDQSLLAFRDWLDSAKGRKAVRENPKQLLKLARRQGEELRETLKRLSRLMGE
jgi:hypothetical protein